MDEGYLTVEGVSKSFGDTVALDDISLGVAEGERITLSGPADAERRLCFVSSPA